LGHLQYLDPSAHKDSISDVFGFLKESRAQTNEPICFYFFLRAVQIILKNFPAASLEQHSESIQEAESECLSYIKTNSSLKETEHLPLEILNSAIECVTLLLKSSVLSQDLATTGFSL